MLARLDDGRNVEVDAFPSPLNRSKPSLREQARQYEEALEEAGIEKTELSADRAPSKAYLSEANASLALHKGFVDDSGLSCAPVAKAPYV